MTRELVFFSLLMLSACSKPSDFRLDLEHRKIVEAGRDLSKGEIIRINITDLGTTERLRFHKCISHECKSAERIAMWTAVQVPSKGWFDVLVREPGKYYFWVEDFSAKYVAYDPDAVMVAKSAKKTGNGLELEYAGGLHIVVKIVCQSKATASIKKLSWIQTKVPNHQRNRQC
jgi:hypothetical protein